MDSNGVGFFVLFVNMLPGLLESPWPMPTQSARDWLTSIACFY